MFGAEYNPDNEVLVTVGVSEALDLALRALLNPGDEVLYHEPCYVSYRATILFANGVPLEVETRAENGFRLTRAMLEAKVTPRTKVLMLNFPNNPTGAVMSRADLEDIAAFALKTLLIVAALGVLAALMNERGEQGGVLAMVLVVSQGGVHGLLKRQLGGGNGDRAQRRHCQRHEAFHTLPPSTLLPFLVSSLPKNILFSVSLACAGVYGYRAIKSGVSTFLANSW